MRKLFSIFVALLAATSLWAYDFQAGDLYYNITSSIEPYTVEVTRCSSYDNYSGLTTATIPNAVTYNGTTYSVINIGGGAFSNCSSLTSVIIPHTVTKIGAEAFSNCFALSTVVIPSSVIQIESHAFENCYSIISLSLPNSVERIDNFAFYNCTALKSLSIPEKLIHLGDWALGGCSSITNIILPESLTFIAWGVFEGCANLQSILIPKEITVIGFAAFNGCRSLQSITIPEKVIQVGEWAFHQCQSLDTVYSYATIPPILEVDAFNQNEAILFVPCGLVETYKSDMYWSVYFSNIQCIEEDEDTENNIYYTSFDGNIVTPNATDVFGANIVSNEYKDGQGVITFDGPVTGIGSWAFANCSSLSTITIPNSVTSIERHTFEGCSALTSVTIGNSVTSIGSGAFNDCSSLTSITCEAETPPTIGYASTFYDVSTSIPVYVPCGCVEAYKAASGWKNFTNIQVPLLEYSIEVDVNDTIMGTTKVDYNTFCEGNQISATPNIGYHFVQWSDGNTENPRTLELTQDTILTAEFAQSFFGQCGDNLYWSYDETTKTVSITGSGKMYDYTADTQPWLLFKEQIVEVTTTNTVTSIGTSAFEGCIRLSKISLGIDLEEIAANAFAGCTRLYDIYVYATYPPFADESSFANYNVYVYIPCEYQRDYILDVVWGKFKFIECLESEDVTTDGNVTIVPGYNDVTITWPTEDNADTYTIVIKKDGEVFCTLTFNAEGQLLNIAFAPSRDGNNRPAQYADQAVNGYRFTVTGLTEATQYAYNITTKDAANKTIATYSGEFTTMGGTTTDMDNIQSPMTNCQKILRDNQLIIVRDGVEYNAMGQEL